MEELAKKEEEGKLAFANDFLKYAKLELDDIKRSFFKIGFRLNEAESMGYYRTLGYSDIYELAEAEFDFKSTTTKNLMAINRRYSKHEHNGHYLAYTMELDDRYKNYTQTQLVEMLPLKDIETKKISADFTVSEIRDYKKILHWGIPKSEKYQNERTPWLSFIEHPREWIEEYRKTNAAAEASKQAQTESAANKWLPPVKPKPKDEPELVADGQMVLTNEGAVEEYHQSGGEGYVGQSTDRTAQEAAQAKLDEIMATADDGDVAEVFAPQRYIFGKEEFAAQTRQFITEAKEPTPPKPARHNFKNNDARKEFINNPANYPVLVLHNEELQLTVRRCDFANGAKIYRTEYKEYSDYHKKTFERVRLCLIDVQEAAEKTGHNASGFFSPKTYTLDGSAPTYIVEYMTKFKNEI